MTRSVDGLSDGATVSSSFTQETVEVAAESVPEPGSVLGLLGLGLGVLATQRKKQA
ncbi:MAG: PEP-CTERM sorting domain-containing protein [Crocosphaera sp.]|nr:PEP-CTERM sorting domain-containing protein [Crocosphaera sp.]